MLVLKRNPGQAVMMETPLGVIWVTVVSISRKRVSLGIEAPEAVVVDREEVFQRKRQDGRKSRPARDEQQEV